MKNDSASSKNWRKLTLIYLLAFLVTILGLQTANPVLAQFIVFVLYADGNHGFSTKVVEFIYGYVYKKDGKS